MRASSLLRKQTTVSTHLYSFTWLLQGFGSLTTGGSLKSYVWLNQCISQYSIIHALRDSNIDTKCVKKSGFHKKVIEKIKMQIFQVKNCLQKKMDFTWVITKSALDTPVHPPAARQMFQGVSWYKVDSTFSDSALLYTSHC